MTLFCCHTIQTYSHAGMLEVWCSEQITFILFLFLKHGKYDGKMWLEMATHMKNKKSVCVCMSMCMSVCLYVSSFSIYLIHSSVPNCMRVATTTGWHHIWNEKGKKKEMCRNGGKRWWVCMWGYRKCVPKENRVHCQMKAHWRFKVASTSECICLSITLTHVSLGAVLASPRKKQRAKKKERAREWPGTKQASSSRPAQWSRQHLRVAWKFDTKKLFVHYNSHNPQL